MKFAIWSVLVLPPISQNASNNSLMSLPKTLNKSYFDICEMKLILSDTKCYDVLHK
jgi:hypothetical protein